MARRDVGVPETFFFDDVDTEVEAAVRETIAKMKAAGATIVPFTLATMDIDLTDATGSSADIVRVALRRAAA